MESHASQQSLRVRRVNPAAPFAWLRLGLDDLLAYPGASLFYGLCFTVMGYAFVYALRYEPQLLAAATMGFLLLGPALAIGLYDISRRRERGEACTLGASMTAWKGNLGNIGLFSLVLIVIYLVWARASLITFALFFSGSLPTLGDLVRQAIAPDNLQFLVIWLGVGSLFAVLVFAIGVISVPLMLDKKCDAVTAVLASLRTVAANPGPMVVWSGVIAWATACALLMGYLGILFVGPLLGHATWHAYRDLIAD